MPPLKLITKMGLINLDLQCHLCYFDFEFWYLTFFHELFHWRFYSKFALYVPINTISIDIKYWNIEKWFHIFWVCKIFYSNAIRQQAITWTRVDLDLCHHMASLGLWINWKYACSAYLDLQIKDSWGISPAWCQAFTWTNAGLLLI